MPACLRTQISEQLRLAIWFGLFTQGQPLPPQRELAERLGVSVKTVHDAYRELQQMGLVESRGGKGMVVVAGQPAGGEIGSLPRLARLQGMRAEAAGFRAGLQGEVAQRILEEGGFAPRVTKPGGLGPLNEERRWVSVRFRQAIRCALRAGFTVEGIEELYKAALQWEVRPR